MIKIDSTYSNYYDDTDPAYPGGKAVDAATDEGIDGTPYKADWMNDIEGALQALFVEAFGSITGITGQPDKVGDSDVVRAIQGMIDNAAAKKFYQFELKGSSNVIPWGDLGRTYNSNVNYLIYAVMTEDNGDVLPIRTSVDSDGVYLRIREIVNDKVQDIERAVTWGSFLFGAKKWAEATSYKVNIIIKEA